MAEEPIKIVSEDELHAYVDGQLPEARHAEVAAWLGAHPEDAAMVAEWQAQNAALLTAFAPESSANPDDLARLNAIPSARRQAPIWRNVAASIALLLVGGLAGYTAHWAITPAPVEQSLLAAFTGEAADAYLTYVREERHAVEVGPDETEHLSAWLGNRLDWEFVIPDLSEIGFTLVGGRLLPINSQPAAMLLFEDQTGQRVSVIIARNNGASDTAWQLARHEDVGTYYWIDGPRSYAISGRLEDPDLRAVTSRVYAAFGEWPENYR